DFIPLLFEQSRSNGRIDAAAHGDNDFCHFDNFRAFSITNGRVLIKESICSAVVPTPRVIRREPKPHSRDKPIASITSLGSGLPVLQAEPDEQAKPAASSRVNNKLPSTPL